MRCIKFDFESVYPTNFSRKYLSGDIWFACKKAHFVIEGIEAVETAGGYRLQGVKGIRQVEESD